MERLSQLDAAGHWQCEVISHCNGKENQKNMGKIRPALPFQARPNRLPEISLQEKSPGFPITEFIT